MTQFTGLSTKTLTGMKKVCPKRVPHYHTGQSIEMEKVRCAEQVLPSFEPTG